jgi:hypothetical protein
MIYYQKNSHIQITAYNGEAGENYRYERLSAVISFCVGAAIVKHQVSPDVFLNTLRAVHDHKGTRLFPGFRVVSQCCVTGGAGAG